MNKTVTGAVLCALLTVAGAGVAEAAPTAAPAFVPPKAPDCTRGGTGLAPPGGGWGPVSQQTCALAGSPGSTIAYSYTSQSDASPIHASAKHFTNAGGIDPGPEQWSEFGAGTSGTSGRMPWGNSLAYPAIKFASINVLGAEVDWS